MKIIFCILSMVVLTAQAETIQRGSQLACHHYVGSAIATVTSYSPSGVGLAYMVFNGKIYRKLRFDVLRGGIILQVPLDPDNDNYAFECSVQ